MNDKHFLAWIHNRLASQHGESLNADYMHKLRAIVEATDEAQDTPNMANVAFPLVAFIEHDNGPLTLRIEGTQHYDGDWVMESMHQEPSGDRSMLLVALTLPKQNFYFFSGAADALKLSAEDRRFILGEGTEQPIGLLQLEADGDLSKIGTTSPETKLHIMGVDPAAPEGEQCVEVEVAVENGDIVSITVGDVLVEEYHPLVTESRFRLIGNDDLTLEYIGENPAVVQITANVNGKDYNETLPVPKGARFVRPQVVIDEAGDATFRLVSADADFISDLDLGFIANDPEIVDGVRVIREARIVEASISGEMGGAEITIEPPLDPETATLSDEDRLMKSIRNHSRGHTP